MARGIEKLLREVYGFDDQDMEELQGKVSSHLQLGVKTKFKFLKAIVPDHFNETVYMNEDNWACHVKGTRLPNDAWYKLTDNIKKELGNNVIEIYSISSFGVQFIVYLKKSKDEKRIESKNKGG